MNKKGIFGCAKRDYVAYMRLCFQTGWGRLPNLKFFYSILEELLLFYFYFSNIDVDCFVVEHVRHTNMFKTSNIYVGFTAPFDTFTHFLFSKEPLQKLYVPTQAGNIYYEPNSVLWSRLKGVALGNHRQSCLACVLCSLFKEKGSVRRWLGSQHQ